MLVRAATASGRLLARERPVPFGRRTAWLALRAEDPPLVLGALRASHVRRAAWSVGIYAAYRADGAGDDAFVTPPLDGWVLVGTSCLPEPGPDGAPLRGLLERLSAELRASVQAFAPRSVLGSRLWARAERGALVRCRAERDADPDAATPGGCDLGEPSEEELALGLAPGRRVDAGDVLALAGAWSLDPTRLDARFADVDPLWVCRLPSS